MDSIMEGVMNGMMMGGDDERRADGELAGSSELAKSPAGAGIAGGDRPRAMDDFVGLGSSAPVQGARESSPRQQLRGTLSDGFLSAQGAWGGNGGGGGAN
eukprot:1704613-Pyramimonas_sp.AAC.1